jgi:hypothetical protein
MCYIRFGAYPNNIQITVIVKETTCWKKERTAQIREEC